MRRTNGLKCQLAILAVSAIVGSAWAQQPGGAYTSNVMRTTATVTAIANDGRRGTGSVTISIQ